MKLQIIFLILVLIKISFGQLFILDSDNTGYYNYYCDTGKKVYLFPDSLNSDRYLRWSSQLNDRILLDEEISRDVFDVYGFNINNYDNKKKIFTIDRYRVITRILDAPQKDRLYITMFEQDTGKTYILDRTSFDILDSIPPIGVGEFKFPQNWIVLSRNQDKIYRLNQGEDRIEFRCKSLETGEIIDEHVVIDGIYPIVDEGQTANQRGNCKGYVLLSYQSKIDSTIKTILIDPENRTAFQPVDYYYKYYGNIYLSKSANEIISEEHAGLDIDDYYHTGVITIHDSKTGLYKQLIKYPAIVGEDDLINGVYLFEPTPNKLYYQLDKKLIPDPDSLYTANLDYIQPADSICSTMLEVATEYNKPEVKLIPDDDVFANIMQFIRDSRDYLRADKTSAGRWILEYFIAYLEVVNGMDAAQYSNFKPTFSQERIALKATLEKGQPATAIISQMQERRSQLTLQKSTAASDSDKVLSDRAKNSLTYIVQKILDERL